MTATPADDGAAVLVIAGDEGDICRLRREPDGTWRGRRLSHDQMPIELTAFGSLRWSAGEVRGVK